jgi:superfamily II DNA/RNA helicase
MNFSEFGFTNPILKAINECGYTTPTPVQEKAMPLVMAGRDVMASAQTGTGKTAGFVLPALQLLSQTERPRTPATPRILVLTPTRELADQIYMASRTYGKYMSVRVACILGGMPYREQFRQLAQCDIVVATPGRLLDHLERGNINLKSLKMLVLDEADRMLDMGFIDDVKRIGSMTPVARQTLLFTATLDFEIIKIAKSLLKDPERVEITPTKVEQNAIEQRLHMTDGAEHKDRLLQHFAGASEVTKAIIFSATKRNADKLATRLKSLGHSAAALHGDMDQRARNRTISSLRNGNVRLLVATDVAARGLDVTGISHVINYDLPKAAEDYVHRIGRTGRAGETGIAVSFATDGEFKQIKMIERYTGKALPVHTVPGLEPVFASNRPRTSAPSRDGRRPEGRPFDRSGGGYNRPRPEGRSYNSPRPEGRDFSAPRPAVRGGGNGPGQQERVGSGARTDGRNSYGARPEGRPYERSFSGPRPEGRPAGRPAGRPGGGFDNRNTGRPANGGSNSGRYTRKDA